MREALIDPVRAARDILAERPLPSARRAALVAHVEAGLEADAPREGLAEALAVRAQTETATDAIRTLSALALLVAHHDGTLEALTTRLTRPHTDSAIASELPWLAARGAPVAPVLRALLAESRPEQWKGALDAALRAAPRELGALCGLALEQGVALHVVAACAGDIAASLPEAPLDDALSVLRAALASPDVDARRAAVQAVEALSAKRRVDVRDELGAPLGDMDPLVRGVAGRALVALDAEDPSALSRWLAHPVGDARAAAFAALSRAPGEPSRIAPMALLALLDEHPYVRQHARQCVLACVTEPPDAGSEAALGALLDALAAGSGEGDAKDWRQAPSRLLEDVLGRLALAPLWRGAVHRAAREAAALGAGRPLPPGGALERSVPLGAPRFEAGTSPPSVERASAERAPRPALARLLRWLAREESAPDPGCPTCAPIGAALTSGGELYERARRALVPEIPEVDHVDFACRCPACGARFESSHEVEVEVVGRAVFVRLARLSLGQVYERGLLSESERTERLASETEALQHPLPEVRERAAWHLESLARAERRWEDLAALLALEDHVARASAARALADASSRARALPDSPRLGAPALAALAALARDPDPALRALGAAARAAEWVAAVGVRVALERAEREPDPALEATIEEASRAPAAELAEALPAVLALGERRFMTGHGTLVSRALRAGLVAPDALAAALSLWARLDPPERATLARALAHWPELEPALVRVAHEALSDRATSSAAATVLLGQARLGADLGAALPALGEALTHGAPQAAYEALVLASKRPELALAAARALALGLGSSGSTSVACALAELGKSTDLAPLADALEDALPRLSCTDRRYVLCALLRSPARSGDEARWLAHPLPEVREDARVARSWI